MSCGQNSKRTLLLLHVMPLRDCEFYRSQCSERCTVFKGINKIFLGMLCIFVFFLDNIQDKRSLRNSV